MKIPDEAIKYIKLQRTQFQDVEDPRLLKEAFIRSLQDNYESMKEYFPETAENVLDIGCGVAGIDVMIHRHYDYNPDLKFYLLDRTQVDENVYYGFREKGAFYNSLIVAKELLKVNGIQENNIKILEATKDYNVQVENVDLVVSLASWGFHFPISTYLQNVYASMKKGAVLLIDVREGVEIGLLEEVFSEVRKIREMEKSSRYEMRKI